MNMRCRFCGTQAAELMIRGRERVAKIFLERRHDHVKGAAPVVALQVLDVLEQERRRPVMIDDLRDLEEQVPCVSQSKPWARPSEFFFETPAMRERLAGKSCQQHVVFRDAPGFGTVGPDVAGEHMVIAIGKVAQVVFCAQRSHSLVKTHLPPIASKPRRMPPIPANRSMNRKPGLAGDRGAFARASSRILSATSFGTLHSPAR